eukprot:272811_1
MSSDEEEVTEKIEQINEGLARYYKRLNKPYNNIFLDYCDNGGFADDCIDDELEEEPADCMLAQFDADFPFKQPIDDAEQKKAQIMEIIKKCYNEPDAFTSDNTASVPRIDATFFSLSKLQKKNSAKLLEEQSDVLYNGGMKTEQTILDIIAIGHKNHYPYINYLADTYSRDVAEGHAKFTDPGGWLKAHPHYTQLQGIKGAEGIKQKPAELTNGALNSYFIRIVPRLILPSQYIIMDSLESTSRYIASSIQFMNNLAKDGTNLPFQLDLCIGYGKVERFDSGANDDEDDDDDEEEEKFEFQDVIGDIEGRLKSNKLAHVMRSIGPKERTERMFDATFKDLQKEVGGSFPNNKRFCTFIDRRTGDDKKSDVYMWQSPENCRNIPNDHVPEWFFNASSTSIIPHETYNKGKEQTNRQNITAQTNCNGGALVLSFHVASVEEIRCYLYANGQMSRFMPQDITGLLPQFFDESQRNKAFMESQAAKELVSSLAIPDVRFEKFCQYISGLKSNK